MFFILLLLPFLVAPINAVDLSFTLKGITQLGTVGAFFECSTTTTHELCKEVIQESSTPRRILELGAGKGIVTAELLRNCTEDDRIDLVELDVDFCAHLRKEFSSTKYPNVQVHQVDMLKFVPEQSYDIIICTLPFNAFDTETVVAMLKKIETLTKKGTRFSYIEYLAGSTVRKITALATASYADEARRYGALQDFKKGRLQETVCIVRNAPPTYVHHLQF
ncbi:methyltransferase domain-containing protein [Candidatus Dependentiae bacterium]|nr:methyltransferase domain-containing protein [Candidatus Dependentiae bacterium]